LQEEAGERISLLITTMLALTVYLLIAADAVPAQSEHFPIISEFSTNENLLINRFLNGIGPI
jgi:hypothetical protein